MLGKIQQRLQTLGIAIEHSNLPAANYIAYKQFANLLYITAQTAGIAGKLQFFGKEVANYSLKKAVHLIMRT